ncbi:hypothetical protein RD055328_12210 [Companilactobacillus sp. RD055328]|uniref:hypothetical protein n=1 Tax=Companilactobacillus sp. RD055328 TaxID=2916634 RepID=UPI001FC886CF|nr:hypothetical protein [Companilactobacillus sp. RD055328]GKQ43298.1 hypothetical protein RD055328_12210 [Companilactobacillus sp. RD055328]
MSNKKIKLLAIFSLGIILASPVSTAISATSGLNRTIVMAPTGNDTNIKNDDNNQTVVQKDDKSEDTVIKDVPTINNDTTAVNNNKIVKDVPDTTKTKTIKNSNVDDQRDLTKWKNYNGPFASILTHIYSGVPYITNNSGDSVKQAIYDMFLKNNLINKKGQMDTGFAKKIGYALSGKQSSSTRATSPVPVRQAGDAKTNAKLTTKYVPASNPADPWSAGTIKFTYDNKINTTANFADPKGLLQQVYKGLGFGAIIQLPDNVTYDQIIAGFENGELSVGPYDGKNNWYGYVDPSTVGQTRPADGHNRWQLKDTEKYFEKYEGDSHKMYFSLHRFLPAQGSLTDPTALAFVQFLVASLLNQMIAENQYGPDWTNMPIKFSTDINVSKAMATGVNGDEDKFKTSDTDESLVVNRSIKRMPPSINSLLKMGVQFYGIDDLNTSNDNDWSINSNVIGTAYEADSNLTTWSNYIQPIDPDTGEALKYDEDKGAYIYDKKINNAADAKKLTDFSQAWNIYTSKIDANPQTIISDKSTTQDLATGGDTVTYSTNEADAGRNIQSTKIYFSNVVNITNFPPKVTDVTINPTTMHENKLKDINVKGNYSDPEGDKVSLSYQVDDGEKIKVDDYQNVKLSKKKLKKLKTSKHTKAANAGSFDFTIKNSDLGNLAQGTHKIHVFASDGNSESDDDAIAEFEVTEPNHNPVVSDVAIADDAKTMEEKSEVDVPVSGKYMDEDGDLVSLQYQIDDGQLKDIAGYQNVSNKTKVKQETRPSVVKKDILPFGQNSILPTEGMNYPDNTVIESDGGKLGFNISYTKTGNPTQTAIGDEITVTTTLTGIAAQKTLVNGQSVFMNMVNSAFIFPYAIQVGGKDNPFTDEHTDSAALYSADGTKKADLSLWGYGDGSFDADPNQTSGMQAMWDASNSFGGVFGSIMGFSLKGTTTFYNNSGFKIYDKEQYRDVADKTHKYLELDGRNPAGINTISYVAQQNKMQENDYFKFTFKYKVNNNAEGMSTDQLKFYSGVYDGSGSSGDNGQLFAKYISTSLPGQEVGSISIATNENEYSDDVTNSKLSSYSKQITGTYMDSTGSKPTIKYEVNPSGETPRTSAKDVTVNTDGTYSADVTSKNWQFGTNTVRFFMTSSDGKKKSYADATIILNQKEEPKKDFNFTIPKEEIAALGDKEIGEHTVRIFATDSEGNVSEEDLTVGTGSTDKFEVTKIPNDPPVINKITNKDGTTESDIKHKSTDDLDLKMNWTDKQSTSFTATYSISDSNGNEAANGTIDSKDLTNPNPGENNTTSFTIPGTQLSKLEADTDYKVTVVLTDDGELSDSSRAVAYTIHVGPANTAPVVDKLTDNAGKQMSINEITEGDTNDFPMKLTWHDDSQVVKGKYTIINTSNSNEIVATGDLGELDNSESSKEHTSSINISGSDISKLENSKVYNIQIVLTDDGGLDSGTGSQIFTLVLKKKIPLEVPDVLTFKPITVGDTRELDARDTGWDKIKRNDSTVNYTVYQSKPWTSSDGKTLSSIEMITSDAQYNDHRGESILGVGNAKEVKFKSDGTLDWSANMGLLEPIGTDSLAGSYSTQLTWTQVNAPQ